MANNTFNAAEFAANVRNFSEQAKAEQKTGLAAIVEAAETKEEAKANRNMLGGEGEPLYMNFEFFDNSGDPEGVIRLPYGMNFVMPACGNPEVNEFTESLIASLRERIAVGERVHLEGDKLFNFMPKLEVIRGYKTKARAGMNTIMTAFGMEPLSEAEAKLANFAEAEQVSTDIIINPIFRAIDEDGKVIESGCAYGINISKMGDCRIKAYNSFRKDFVTLINSERSPVKPFDKYVFSAEPKQGEGNLRLLIKGATIQHGKLSENEGKAIRKLTINL